MTDLDRVAQILDDLLALGVSEEAVQPIRDWLRDRREELARG